MASAGAVIVDPFTIPDFGTDETSGATCSRPTSRRTWRRWAGRAGRNLAGIVASGKCRGNNGVCSKPGFRPAATAACLDVYSDPRNIKFREASLKAMDEAKVGVIVYPTWPTRPGKWAIFRARPATTARSFRARDAGLGVPMGCVDG
jgi:hypothetical protein